MKNIVAIFLITVFLAASVTKSSAQFILSASITVRTAPPPLPFYAQPPCPVDGYLWSPGYWAYDQFDGYYWVPGVWTRPPMIGYLWTPGYWGFGNGIYGWHGGYWGPHVGFYGGVNYGYGYGGSGYGGGAWQGAAFRYNTAVVNVNTTVVRNTYIDRTVINNTTINNTTVNNRPSFNGPGGVAAKPTVQEQSVMRENHVQATSEQVSHNRAAGNDRNQFASVNNGHPATTAMNSVNGQRFNQQGRNAPPAVARPAGGIKPATNNPNHPVANNRPVNAERLNGQRPDSQNRQGARPNNQQPSIHRNQNVNHQQVNNRPAQHSPNAQPIRNNNPHPQERPKQGGEHHL